MQALKKISVFCGANAGSDFIYTEIAQKLALQLVAADIALIYGGGKVGLMGVLADAVLSHHGKVIGVMPTSLIEKEIAHRGITQLLEVSSLHERKALIAELADGFILLPGGAGSLDEFFEMLTWAQLGIHAKPCGILNIANYFDDLLKFLDNVVAKKFMKSTFREMIIVENEPDRLLQCFANYEPPKEFRWMGTATTTDCK